MEQRGDTGLARAQETAFDVVITDLKLPGLNGLELVRELHAARPRLPILMMTAHGTTETAIEATQSGAYDYLVKPFEMPELLGLVEQAVTASRLMSEPVQIGDHGSGARTPSSATAAPCSPSTRKSAASPPSPSAS